MSNSSRAWKASCGCSATEHDDATKVTPCPIHSMEQALSIMTEQAVKEVAPTGPQWRYLTDADETGWYWLEDEPRHIPMFVEKYRFSEIDTMTWRTCTGTGWRVTTSRVAPCTGRPKGGA